MSVFLVDTLVWTGVLLALVLLIRRPVASLFGPKAAYALWALPMARMLLPPLVLPAWMSPDAVQPLEPASGTIDPLMFEDSMATSFHGGMSALAAPPVDASPSLLDTMMGVDWLEILLPMWLAGAAVFLVRRYALYFKMRRELLDGARPMGEAGRVRLVETPAADGPVAFGVIDKVIALPMGFMAGRDRAARDLALAHELAHHRARDLLCNMLVQPLFALHWFNPLSVLGWRALRRDQEAACDARVMARQPRAARAVYAEVITRFATEPRHAARLALAAPMACPVLGDRSIVQRLKSLSMTEVSASRRWSGRFLIGAAALALPLTGSISYAQSEPATSPVPPATPAPPVAVTAPTAPDAPLPPEPPAPPSVTVSEDGKVRIVRIEHRGEGADGSAHPRIERRVIIQPGAKLTPEEQAKLRKHLGELKPGQRHVIIRDGETFVDGRKMSAEERADFEKDMRELRDELRKEFGKNGELQRELERELGEHSEFQKEMRQKFGENGEFQREMRVAVADARIQASRAVARAPRVSVSCREGQREVAETVTSEDGKQRIFVCNSIAKREASRAYAEARADIAEARADIARSRDLTAQQRAEALRSIDEAERNLRAD